MAQVWPIRNPSGNGISALGWGQPLSNRTRVHDVAALEKNVAVFKVQNGRRIPILPGVKHDLPPNAWTILKVSVRGNRFQVYLDHRRILQGTDNTFIGSGGVGLWTAGDSVAYFDDFRVFPK